MAEAQQSKFTVTLTDTEIISRRPDGKTERVALNDLKAIMIETNDSGPFAVDVWWLLLGSNRESSCIFPMGAEGEDTFLAFAQKLPGFDNQAFIQAMQSTENQRFLCWRQPAVSKEQVQ
jgi:hypothetical protein